MSSNGTPIEFVASLVIGSVEFVSPGEIKVLLETDAPQATALNTGVPVGFPRINSYVLIPNEVGAVVGMVTWMGVERSAFPKRTGVKDFGLIDLPFPLRKLSLIPVGTLYQRGDGKKPSFELDRGVAVFPSVGDSVLLPTDSQLKSIIEASDEKNRRVHIGTSPLASSANVTVDPDRVFGRHLAVLGNTGSGKSCTVAGLIRWSLEAAIKDRQARERTEKPNARFIILDPNGEYSKTFDGLSNVRQFRIGPVKDGVEELVVPAWMWNSHEWAAFTEAKSGVQRPLLMRALRELRAFGEGVDLDPATRCYLDLRSFYRSVVADMNRGAPAYIDKPGKGDFGQKLQAIADSIEHSAAALAAQAALLNGLAATIRGVANGKHKTFTNNQGEVIPYYEAFTAAEVQSVVTGIDQVLEQLPVPHENLSVNEDSPVPFDPSELAHRIEQIATEQGQTQYVDTLLLRIRMLLSDERMKSVVAPNQSIELSQWLENIVGDTNAENGCISIIDLSLVPSSITHTIVAVIARLIFEASQRYRRITEKEIPTVLVLEEAHTFIHRHSEGEESSVTPSQMCRQTFERIAREGRKFGLGLVLSSQRPSELSATVLAQCNTFILHRLVNDRDQELVGKLVPDNLGGLLKELPSLPSRQAILLGWAAPVPVLVEINELDDDHRPRSADPHFWDVWTGDEERTLDWQGLTADWVGAVLPAPPEEGNGGEQAPGGDGVGGA